MKTCYQGTGHPQHHEELHDMKYARQVTYPSCSPSNAQLDVHGFEAVAVYGADFQLAARHSFPTGPSRIM